MTENKTPPQDELSAADLADFDDAVAGQEDNAKAMADDAPAAKDEEAPAAAATEEAAPAAKVEDAPAATEAGNQPTIPKARFDEAIQKERERADARAAELQAEIDKLKAGPPVNYSEEIKALKQRYEDDDDFTLEAYMEQHSKLVTAQAKAETREELLEEQRQLAAQRAEQAWADAAAAFVAAHPEYADGEAKTDLEAALHGVFAKFPTASDADKLERAHKIVQAMNGKAEPAAPAAPANPHAIRNAADATAQARASAAPNPAGAGSGDRGLSSFPGIGPEMQDKDYKALPKDLRESKELASF